MARAILIGIILGVLIFYAAIFASEVFAQEKPIEVPPFTSKFTGVFPCHNKQQHTEMLLANNMTSVATWSDANGRPWELFKNMNDMWWIVFYDEDDVCAVSIKPGFKVI